MRLNKMTLGIIGALLVSGAASARPLYDVTMYAPVVVGGTHTAQASFNGNFSTLAASDMANTSAPMAQLLGGASNFYWSIRSKITAGVAEALAQSGQNASITTPGGMSGDINVSVSGLPDGNLSMRLNGLTYSVGITARKSNWLGTVTCNSQVYMNSLSLASQFNPFTGAVAGTSVDFTPTQSTSCDSSYSWIPFIGDFIDRKASSLIGNAILQQMNSVSGQVLTVAPQNAFLGFTSAIEPGKHMIGGFDAGMYIKNNIQSLYTGKTINLFLANDYKYNLSSRSSPGPSSATGTAFSINFSDANGQAGFSINTTKQYTWREYIIPGTNGPEPDKAPVANVANKKLAAR
ncbi:hypothetical protein ACFDR9_005408 [Janthinobacterium sp. CG_23.3]